MIPKLIRAWYWLHLLSLAAIALQPSSPAVILGRYSTRSALILAVFALSTPVIRSGTRWLAGQVEQLVLKPWQYAAILLSAAALLFALWVAPIGPTSSYQIVRLYLTFVLFTTAIWASQRLTFPAWLANAPGVLGVAWGLALLVVSTRFPGLFWTDEGFAVSAALGFVEKGYPRVSIFQPAQVEGYSLIYLGLGAWFRVFGVSVSAGRAFVFTTGLVSLAFLFLAARSVYTSFAAWMAVILGAFAFIANNYLRADIGVALALSIAFYGFVLAQKTGRDWLHLLVGFALGFSLDGHPNAYRFCIAFGVAYLVEAVLHVRQRRCLGVYWPFVYLVAGGALGFLAYFALYATITVRFLEMARTPSLALNLPGAPGVLLDQFVSALLRAPALTGAAALGAVVALRRRNSLDRLLLAVGTVGPSVLALHYGYYRDYYLTQLIPVLALLAAGLWWELEQAVSRPALGALAISASLACLGFLIHALASAGSQSYDQALDVARRLRAYVPKNAVFVGVDPLYHEMADYAGFTEMGAAALWARQAGIDEREAWEQIAPTSVAVVHGYPIAPRAALLDYIAAHALTQVRCWSTSRLGLVELYVRQAPTGLVPSAGCEVIE